MITLIVLIIASASFYFGCVADLVNVYLKEEGKQ